MSKLAAAALRVCKALDPDETFNADRVFKLLYLVDWKSILTHNGSLTGITWTGGGGADLVGDVLPEDEELVDLLQTQTGTGTPKDVLPALERRVGAVKLSDREKQIIRFVMKQAGRKDWRQLNDLVFSTRPLIAGRIDQPLNLESHARAHRAASPRSGELTSI